MIFAKRKDDNFIKTIGKRIINLNIGSIAFYLLLFLGVLIKEIF